MAVDTVDTMVFLGVAGFLFGTIYIIVALILWDEESRRPFTTERSSRFQKFLEILIMPIVGSIIGMKRVVTGSLKWLFGKQL